LERDRPQCRGQANRGETLLDDRLGAVQVVQFGTAHIALRAILLRGVSAFSARETTWNL
jgi:hypothetical protein